MPPGSPGLAYQLYNLAGTLRDQGKLAEAESCYREALEIRLKHIAARPRRHPLEHALLGVAPDSVDRAEEAVPLIDEFVGSRGQKGSTGFRAGIGFLIGVAFAIPKRPGTPTAAAPPPSSGRAGSSPTPPSSSTPLATGR